METEPEEVEAEEEEFEPEPAEDPDELLPDEPETDVDAEIAAVEDLEPFDEDLDELIVDEAEPQPVGKSWAFDFAGGQFLHAPARGPSATWGETTLRYWVEKVLRTPRGMLPIHDASYGVQDLRQMIGRLPEEVIADLESRVTTALLFHPRITEVRDFIAEYDPADEFMDVSFTVVTDEEGFEELSFSEVRIRPGGVEQGA